MYGLFSYALQPAKGTSVSFMVEILEEYLIIECIGNKLEDKNGIKIRR